MLKNIIPAAYENLYYGLFFLAGFLVPFLTLVLLRGVLPRDKGREFALNGKLSEGKPRGAGILMLTSTIVVAALFVPLTLELIIYLGFIYIEMLCGYLDDCAAASWGRLKKGLLDLAVSIGIAVTYVIYNGSTLKLALFGVSFTLPAAVYVILAVALVWGSINVTNCSDGVDGLCGSLSLVSLVTVYLIMKTMTVDDEFRLILLAAALMLGGYLWFNCSPSLILMGDAGSRALGVMLAVAAMKLGSPVLFLIFAFMLIIDGGSSLFKITVIKLTKNKDFMKNIRTPLHDHMRKNHSWSDTQVVVRFTAVQAIVNLALVGFLM